jgi:predicted permease
MLRSIVSGDFGRDLRYASRLLRANPLFTTVVVLTLALGIGANTAIFSVMNAVVLRSLPVPEPDRLVNLHTSGWPDGSTQTGRGDASFPMVAFQQMRAGHAALSGLMAYVPLAIGKTAVRVGSEPEEAEANMVSGNFFSGLGVQTLCGRTLTDTDETSHAAVAVLGYGYWSRRFGANCSAVGQTIHVRDVPFTIVGVAARGFLGVDSAGGTDVWLPLQDRADLNAWGRQEGTPYSTRNWWFLMMVGRLAPGVNEQQALGRLNPVFQRAAFEAVGRQPKAGEKAPNLSFTSVQGLPGLRRAYLEPLRILLAMVGLVLLIACGNVALLLAARNATRLREFSIRMAMGGGRLQLFRQLLTESLVLVMAGAGLAWLFALAATRALSTWSGLAINMEPDRSVLLFTLAIALAVALTFGLAPLRSAAGVHVGLTLKTSSATAHTDRQRSWGRKSVIALQVALCLVLVIGAGLLVRTLRNLESVNLGMRTAGLLVFGISPQQQARTDADRIRFFESLRTRLRALPGVESVTLMSNRLASGWSNNTSAAVDGKRPDFQGSAHMRWNAVGPDYFTTLGTPLLQGRDLRDSDAASAPKVAVVNETFAKRYLANQDPIGHLVGMSTRGDAPQYTIVGVAADSKYTGVREGATAMAYFPYQQIRGVGTMHIEVRTAGSAEALLPTVQRAVREFAPDLPLLKPMTQQSQFAESFTQERLFARLAMCFGLLAVALVTTGIYGTLAYMVNRRTSEIGIRMALGARRGQVLMMVLRESGVVFGAGVLVGVPLAIVATRLLRSMLFGVASSDPLTFAAGLALIAVVALIASVLPARRAASTDPMVALRYE